MKIYSMMDNLPDNDGRIGWCGGFEIDSEATLSIDVDNESGTQYMFSAWLKCNQYGIISPNELNVSKGDYVNANAWKRVSFIADVIDNQVNLVFSQGKWQIYKAQLERGNKLTDWKENADEASVENVYVGGTTQIDGGKIYTGSIKAESIDVDEALINKIFAEHIEAGDINVTGDSVIAGWKVVNTGLEKDKRWGFVQYYKNNHTIEFNEQTKNYDVQVEMTGTNHTKVELTDDGVEFTAYTTKGEHVNSQTKYKFNGVYNENDELVLGFGEDGAYANKLFAGTLFADKIICNNMSQSGRIQGSGTKNVPANTVTNMRTFTATQRGIYIIVANVNFKSNGTGVLVEALAKSANSTSPAYKSNIVNAYGVKGKYLRNDMTWIGFLDEGETMYFNVLSESAISAGNIFTNIQSLLVNSL